MTDEQSMFVQVLSEVLFNFISYSCHLTAKEFGNSKFKINTTKGRICSKLI